MPNCAATSACESAPGSSGSNCFKESNNPAWPAARYSSFNRLSTCSSIVNAQFLQRNEPLSFSSLDRHGMARLVGKKILERHNEIRTKSPLLLADGIQIFALQQQREETLREIFCLLGANTLSPHEAKNRSPINAAELFERFLRRWRITLCLEHHAPVRGSKRGYLPLSGILARAHYTI